MALQYREKIFLKGQFRTREVSLLLHFLVLETQTPSTLHSPLSFWCRSSPTEDFVEFLGNSET